MSELEDSLRKIIREEIERAMPMEYRGYRPPQVPLGPGQLMPGQCCHCGNYHGEGMMCPWLRPISRSAF